MGHIFRRFHVILLLDALTRTISAQVRWVSARLAVLTSTVAVRAAVVLAPAAMAAALAIRRLRAAAKCEPWCVGGVAVAGVFGIWPEV